MSSGRNSALNLISKEPYIMKEEASSSAYQRALVDLTGPNSQAPAGVKSSASSLAQGAMAKASGVMKTGSKNQRNNKSERRKENSERDGQSEDDDNGDSSDSSTDGDDSEGTDDTDSSDDDDQSDTGESSDESEESETEDVMDLDKAESSKTQEGMLGQDTSTSGNTHPRIQAYIRPGKPDLQIALSYFVSANSGPPHLQQNHRGDHHWLHGPKINDRFIEFSDIGKVLKAIGNIGHLHLDINLEIHRPSRFLERYYKQKRHPQWRHAEVHQLVSMIQAQSTNLPYICITYRLRLTGDTLGDPSRWACWNRLLKANIYPIRKVFRARFCGAFLVVSLPEENGNLPKIVPRKKGIVWDWIDHEQLCHNRNGKHDTKDCCMYGVADWCGVRPAGHKRGNGLYENCGKHYFPYQGIFARRARGEVVQKGIRGVPFGGHATHQREAEEVST
jgi:hypothetical protein